MRAVSRPISLLLLLWPWTFASAQSVPAESPPAAVSAQPAEVRFDDSFRALGQGASDVPASQLPTPRDERLQITAGPLTGIASVRATRTQNFDFSQGWAKLLGAQAAVQYGVTPRGAVRALMSAYVGLGDKERGVSTDGRWGNYVSQTLTPLSLFLDLEYSLRPGLGPVRASFAARLGYVGEVGSALVSGAFMGGGMLGMAFLMGREQRFELHARGGWVVGTNTTSKPPPRMNNLAIPLELSLLYRFF